jgi:hypothetical protein
MKDYSEYDDSHAKSRDKKHDKRVEQKLMRGNRSVFEIEKSQQNRDRRNREHKKGYEDDR